eukprot:g27258.t1
MANDLSQDLPNGPLSARSRDGYTEVPERRCSGDESITSSDRVRRLKAIPRHSDVCEETLRLQKKKQRRSISEASKASVIASLKRTLCKDLEYYAFSAGEVIVRQGEEGDHLFIVEVGLLEVSIHGRPTNDMVAGEDAREMSVAFGCTALLYNVPRTATVTAKEDSGLWALGGGTFRKLLRDHAERHQAQHLHLLERIHILDGLSNVQKVNVGAVALLDESFTSGHLVASEGEECRRLYLVKSGALQLVQGGEREGTHWLGGTPIKEVGTGGVFGEDYLRIDASHTLEGNLVAVGDTSLACVLIEKLASVLGEHVELQLEKAFVGLSLRRTPWFDSFPRPRQQCIMSNQVKVISCPPGAAVRDLERVSSMPYYALVLEGSFVAGEVTLRRGQSCQSVAVERLEFFCSSSTELNRGPSLAGESIRPEELIAGPDHGRFSRILSQDEAHELPQTDATPQDLQQHGSEATAEKSEAQSVAKTDGSVGTAAFGISSALCALTFENFSEFWRRLLEFVVLMAQRFTDYAVLVHEVANVSGARESGEVSPELQRLLEVMLAQALKIAGALLQARNEEHQGLKILDWQGFLHLTNSMLEQVQQVQQSCQRKVQLDEHVGVEIQAGLLAITYSQTKSIIEELHRTIWVTVLYW